MKIIWSRIIPHLFVVLGFVIISIGFFNPVLSGKVIYQSDIVQHNGMAKQQRDFIADTGEESYWMDNAFGGMPTYQTGANYPHNYIKNLDKLIRFLPRPSDYLFIYFLGLYLLFMVLKVEPKFAFLGALAFGFSTYLIIILGVGHNAKAHAIAYMPLVISGILLCFRNKLFWGFLALSLGLALELVANHFQMTYYLLLLCVCIGLVYLYHSFKNKQILLFAKQLGVMILAAVLALGFNASNLLATKEYTDFSTRGTEELNINPDGTVKEKTDGLDYEYITEYSYGIIESFNLFIPNFKGGSSSQALDTDSETYQTLLKLTGSTTTARQYAESMPTYWGAQTFVAAPAYVGAGILFLFLLASFLVRSKIRYWIFAGASLSLLLSWGDNFSILTRFFVDYVPLYNKFRAVSSIQVILELCVPIFAILGLKEFFSTKRTEVEKIKALKWSGIIAGSVCVFVLLFNGSVFDFYHPVDQQFPDELAKSIRKDRQAMLVSDTWRSFLIIGLISGSLWLLMKQKLKTKFALIAIGVVVVFDLILVDRRYVNEDDFVQKSKMERPFQRTAADQQILKDTSHFRVLDLSGNPFNSARASFFHNSIGGYHAAKPKRIQNLYEFYISEGHQGVLNMMNVKYFIMHPENQGLQVQINDEANGNVWFVNKIETVESIDEEVLALGNLNSKNTAVMLSEEASNLPELQFSKADQNFIELTNHQPNKQVYAFNASTPQFAVFSESFYKHGWVAKINGEEQPIYRVNYLLRGLAIPAGEGQITFEFNPPVVKVGSKISLASSIFFMLLLLFGLYKLKQTEN